MHKIRNRKPHILKKVCWCKNVVKITTNCIQQIHPTHGNKRPSVGPETRSTASWNRVRTERVRRGRLRRVSKILETRGNFDEVSEIKKSTIFYRNKFSSLNRAVQSQPTQGNKRPTWHINSLHDMKWRDVETRLEWVEVLQNKLK